MGRTKIDNTKDIKYVFRPSTTTIELLELYLQESGSANRTQAIEDLIQMGGTVWVKNYYDTGGD